MAVFSSDGLQFSRFTWSKTRLKLWILSLASKPGGGWETGFKLPEGIQVKWIPNSDMGSHLTAQAPISSCTHFDATKMKLIYSGGFIAITGLFGTFHLRASNANRTAATP